MDTDQWHNLSFSTIFNYLHVVKKGTVTTNSSAAIDLPAGLTTPFYRVFISNGTQVMPVGGYFNTGSDARITGGQLVISVFGGGGGETPPSQTFTYFIYGGNYE